MDAGPNSGPPGRMRIVFIEAVLGGIQSIKEDPAYIKKGRWQPAAKN